MSKRGFFVGLLVMGAVGAAAAAGGTVFVAQELGMAPRTLVDKVVKRGTDYVSKKADMVAHKVAAMTASQEARAEKAVPSPDFERRCNDPAVVLCDPLDVGLPLKSEYGDWKGVYADKARIKPVMDKEIKASGLGSLKFTVPSKSGPSASGSFYTNFTKDNSVQFGEGETFFIQWRQRFSRNMLFDDKGNHREYKVEKGKGGFKTAIIGTGDDSRLKYPTNSCTNAEIVLFNGEQSGAVHMYHSCSWYKGIRAYYKLHKRTGQHQIDFQPGGDNHCWRLDPDSGQILKNAWPDCAMFEPDEWMTFQVQVTIGTWTNNSKDKARNSRIKLWVAREGQPSRLVIDKNLNLKRPEKPFLKYGKIWLLPYHTAKNAAEAHPEAYTWYDELIVSRKRIPDPK